MMKLAIENAPQWVRDAIKAHGKRPKSLYLHVVASGASHEFTSNAGDGEQTYTYIWNGAIRECRRSSWGGANPFVPKSVNEFSVTFTPGKQVLETNAPKHSAFFLTVASIDPVAKMGVDYRVPVC